MFWRLINGKLEILLDTGEWVSTDVINARLCNGEAVHVMLSPPNQAFPGVRIPVTQGFPQSPSLHDFTVKRRPFKRKLRDVLKPKEIDAKLDAINIIAGLEAMFAKKSKKKD